MDTCISCHISGDSPNPLTTSGSGDEGKHVVHYSSSEIDCEVCHQGYDLSATHDDLTTDTSDPLVNMVNFDPSNPSGEWVNDTGAQTGRCANTDCHSAYTPPWYITSPPSCLPCHDDSGRPELNPMLTNGTGAAGMHVEHYITSEIDCLKCHAGYYFADTHDDGTFDTPDLVVNIVSFDATNPSGTWTNDSGAGTGQCSSTVCHSPNNLNWYDMSTWTPPPCSSCHEAAIGTRKPVMGAMGNFAGNTGMATFHVADAVDPTDAKCLICHDQTYHMSGTIRLVNADTSAITELDESDLSTAESFCLSCHDDDGAMALGISNMTPFEDGITLGAGRYKMSSEINDRWNRANGHRQEGLTCLGTGEPNTGCHAGGHGSEFAGLLTKKLLMPNSYGPYTPDKEPNYALCFECHDSYPAVTKEVVLGVKEGSVYDNNIWWSGVYPPYLIQNTVTKFLDRNEQDSGEPYDDPIILWLGLTTPYENLHFYHLEDYYDGWFYRGVSTSRYGTESPSCITCHDMHGTDSQWGFLYDEFQYEHYTGTGSDEYAQMGIPVRNLSNFPINCDNFFGCHSYLGTTSAWFAPVLQ